MASGQLQMAHTCCQGVQPMLMKCTKKKPMTPFNGSLPVDMAQIGIFLDRMSSRNLQEVPIAHEWEMKWPDLSHLR